MRRSIAARATAGAFYFGLREDDMKTPGILGLAMGAALVTFAPNTGFAQKSKDTLRIAINDPFSAINTYQVPHEEGGYFSRGMYGRLIALNEYTGKFVPMLAKS
jgi:ABC-type oligopeptide transport system substrate-binding subunit